MMAYVQTTTFCSIR